VAKQPNMGQQNAKKLYVKNLYPEQINDLIATCEETWTHHYNSGKQDRAMEINPTKLTYKKRNRSSGTLSQSHISVSYQVEQK
jgi:hypothetical protein